MSKAKGKPELSIVPTDAGQCRVLTLSGRLTTDACEMFRAAAVTEIEDGTRELVIDISGLETMSSCGIGTLVWIDDDCRKSKCRMQLVNSNSHIERVMALTGLDRQFRISKTVDAATRHTSDD
jgi:anti-sigma B factor antagonist